MCTSHENYFFVVDDGLILRDWSGGSITAEVQCGGITRASSQCFPKYAVHVFLSLHRIQLRLSETLVFKEFKDMGYFKASFYLNDIFLPILIFSDICH